MKKQYIAPELSVVQIELNQIVCQSISFSNDEGDGSDMESSSYRSKLWHDYEN